LLPETKRFIAKILKRLKEIINSLGSFKKGFLYLEKKR